MPTNSQSSTGINSNNQEKLLQEAKISVKTDALLMKKSLVNKIKVLLSNKLFWYLIYLKDKLDLLEGIKHASDMLNKLGNIAKINNNEVMLSLSPKNYYDLCKL